MNTGKPDTMRCRASCLVGGSPEEVHRDPELVLHGLPEGVSRDQRAAQMLPEGDAQGIAPGERPAVVKVPVLVRLVDEPPGPHGLLRGGVLDTQTEGHQTPEHPLGRDRVAAAETDGRHFREVGGRHDRRGHELVDGIGSLLVAGGGTVRPP